MNVRILLCDNRPLLLDGLRFLLSREPDIAVVGSTGSGTRAVTLARDVRPHVVVSGPDLAGIDGLELARRLASERLEPQPQVILLTVAHPACSMPEALRNGVRGLLADDASREELALAIRAVARGQVIFGPRDAQCLIRLIRQRDAPVVNRVDIPAGAALTSREREILGLAAHGMSTDDIAAKLLISPTTVRTHLYRLKSKLQVRDRAQLVSLAYRAGIVPS